MKKILLILTLLIIIILGCEKDKPRCWGCTQVVVYSMPGFLPDTTITKYIKCNLDKETVLDLMHWYTYEAQQCVNGTMVDIQSSYHCIEATCWEE
jgi:hypothetical protein